MHMALLLNGDLTLNLIGLLGPLSPLSSPCSPVTLEGSRPVVGVAFEFLSG